MTNISRRRFLQKTAALSAATLGAATLGVNARMLASQGGYPALPEARWDKLPRWRGFNLLNYFMEFQQSPFEEQTFRDIADCGFNFVRLPMDYRSWILDKDWSKIDGKKLDEIFAAVTFGEKYGIHVQFNFHRAPGYTVAQPREEKSLWTDSEAREVCCRHWAEFARRCRGLSNANVSFNLFNEPDNVSQEELLPATAAVIEAIRAEDPDRLIVCDGRRWAREPIPALIPYRVAQAARGYDPMEISHYGASWVDSENYPYPTWPMLSANGLLVSPHKGDVPESLHCPLTVTGPFVRESQLRLRIETVSTRGTLSVEADGREILRREFIPGEGEGEWKKAIYSKWNVWQNFYDLDIAVSIPAKTKALTIRNLDGDWIQLSELALQPNGAERETILPLRSDWSGESCASVAWTDESALFTSEDRMDRDWLWKNGVEPWTALAERGVGVMVGEFGAYNKTPHDVVLRWMEDMLANWKKAGFGWALWNWTGAIGVVESGRADVDYEEWRGQKLDRKMLGLLQKY